MDDYEFLIPATPPPSQQLSIGSTQEEEDDIDESFLDISLQQSSQIPSFTQSMSILNEQFQLPSSSKMLTCSSSLDHPFQIQSPNIQNSELSEQVQFLPSTMSTTLPFPYLTSNSSMFDLQAITNDDGQQNFSTQQLSSSLDYGQLTPTSLPRSQISNETLNLSQESVSPSSQVSSNNPSQESILAALNVYDSYWLADLKNSVLTTLEQQNELNQPFLPSSDYNLPFSQQNQDIGGQELRSSQPCSGFSQNSQIFTGYSDDIFEGVLSQEWTSKPQDDPVWKKLNDLRDELINSGLLGLYPSEKKSRRSKAESSEKRKKTIKKIKFLINRFNSIKDPPIGMLARRDWRNASFHEVDGIQLKNEKLHYRLIRKVKQGRMLILLCRIFVLLSGNKYSTKRDLYYQDKIDYKRQTICDELIEDLCCIMHQSRRELHIISCPKGLIYGKLVFRIDNCLYNCIDHNFGLTISQDIDSIEDIQSDARFILVIEKDATFQHLISRNILDKFPVIMITGKGFPDVDTRRLLKILVNKLSIPVLGLFDANPFGIEIMCIYRYGSLAMAYDSKSCVVPQIRWLGLLPSDITEWKINEDLTDQFNDIDRAKIASLKKRPYVMLNEKWREQIELIEKNGVKAELQAVENIVESYLPSKIQNGGWI